MRSLTAIALGAGILFAASGCAAFQQDYIVPQEDFGVEICSDTTVGHDELLTGLPFVVPADNADPVEVGFAELINPHNIELVASYVVRDGLTSGNSISGGAIVPEDIDASFEPAEGAMLDPDEGGFDLVVQVRSVDPTVPATFDAVRLTYSDDDAEQFTVQMPSDFSFKPGCE